MPDDSDGREHDIEIDSELDRRIAGIAALDQPVRRDLYRVLGRAGGWTSRDDAADALAMSRAIVAFHLDKLVEAGVVETRFARLGGRTGPGAGRPSKLYRPTAGELAASVPPRQYDLAGSLLAAAVAEATRTGSPVAACLRATARAAGRALGARAEDDAPTAGGHARASLTRVLEEHGYEPRLDGTDEITLANCPFHRLAEEQRDLVCGMNLDLLSGLLDGIHAEHLTAELQPTPGSCCVRIIAA